MGTTPKSKIHEGHISFVTSDGKEAVRMEPNGKFFVEGREVETDRALYEGFRNFLKKSGYWPE